VNLEPHPVDVDFDSGEGEQLASANWRDREYGDRDCTQSTVRELRAVH